MYKINIKDRVDAKFNNINKFAVAVGISFGAAEKLYKGETVRIAFDTLEAICNVFNCTPNDIFVECIGNKEISISELQKQENPFLSDGYKTITSPNTNAETISHEKIITTIDELDATIHQASILKAGLVSALDIFRDPSIIKKSDDTK